MTRKAFIRTGRVPPRTCPGCQRVLDAATGAYLDKRPPPGNDGYMGCVTVCAYCATVLVVTPTGFRIADDADLDALDPAARAIVLKFVQEHGGRGE
jgi:hypothetical protein